MPRSSWRPAVRLLVGGLFAGIVAGCIIIPTPENILLEGRGAIEESEGAILVPGETRREDVVLRFGEPDLVADEGRALVYHWARASAWVLIGAYPGGAVMPLAKHHFLLLEFDQAGRLQRHEFLDKLPDSMRRQAVERPFVAPAERQVIRVNPLPAWPDAAGLIGAGPEPLRLALGAFLPAQASAPEFLGQVKSFGIVIADVRASRAATDLVRAAVAAQLQQSGHMLVPPDQAEVLVSGESVVFRVATPMRKSLSLDVVASLDVTLRFACAGSSGEVLQRRFETTTKIGPAEPVTVAELQYATTACLEELQRQLREDAGVAALLAGGPGACR